MKTGTQFSRYCPTPLQERTYPNIAEMPNLERVPINIDTDPAPRLILGITQ